MTRIALVFDTDGDVDPEWLKHAQSLATSHDLLPGGVQVANIFKVPDDGQVGVLSS